MNLSTNDQVWEFGLAAKFFIRRALNMEAMARTFKPLWHTHYGFQICDVGNNHLVFAFEAIVDAKRVLIREPWSFDRHLVAFQKMDGSTPVQELDLRQLYFGSRSIIYLSRL